MKRDLISSRPTFSECYFDTPVTSTETLAGIVRQLPGSGAPCSAVAYSGLSRSQQQVAMQALGPPATPCFSGNQGGLLLDGVVLRTGGTGWWAALSGRFRVQKAINLVRQSKEKNKKRFKEVLKGENYGFCCRCKWTLGRKSTLNLMYEVSSLEELREKLCQPELYPEQFQAGHLQLKHKLLKGHDFTGSVACNLRYQDESGNTGDALPLLVSADLATPSRNEPLFQYRLGISNVIGQLYQQREGVVDNDHDDNPYVQQTNLQGTIGFQKRLTLYQNNKNGRNKSSSNKKGYRQNKGTFSNNDLWQFSQNQRPPMISSGSQVDQQQQQQQQSSGPDKRLSGRAKEIQSLLCEARKRLEYFRTSLQEMIEDVEEGKFQEQLRYLGKGSRSRRSLYNMFAGSKVQLHLKAGWRVHRILRPALPSAPTLPLFTPHSSTPFGQVNLHTQLGNFTRPLLSFTTLDLGLQYNLLSQRFGTTNNTALFQTPDKEGSQKLFNNAFVLESGRMWNCLSMGVSQQLIGPVVGRADFKFELEGLGDGKAWGRRLVDECYGIDVALPGGVAKFSVWWAPRHREAFAEIRTW